MFDKFKRHAKTIDSVAENAFFIAPNDTEKLALATRSIYVGGGGNLTVVMIGDSDPVTFINVVAGTILPIRVQKVLATGTTATNMVGLL